VHAEVAGLNRVGEGHPDEVAEGQHEAEAVVDDVDRGQDGGLHPQRVKDVDSLGDGDDEHRVSHVAVRLVLLGHESQVKDEPAEHTGPELHPSLDVHLAGKRQSDTRVQLATNEPVVDDISTVAARSELAQFLVAALDLERAHVDVDGEQERDKQVGRDQTDVVPVDERPDGEVGALGKSAGGADGQDGRGGAEGIEPVLEPAAVLELDSLNLLRGQDSVQDQAQHVPGERSQHAIDSDKTAPARPSHLLCQN